MNYVEIVCWIAVLVIAIYIEVTTTALVSFWFALGALVAAILAALSIDVNIQLLVFTIVSLVALLVFKIFFKKFNSGESEDTKVDSSLINLEGSLLSKASTNSPGVLVINGVPWNVVTESGEIDEHEQVVVLKTQGNRLVVKRKE